MIHQQESFLTMEKVESSKTTVFEKLLLLETIYPEIDIIIDRKKGKFIF